MIFNYFLVICVPIELKVKICYKDTYQENMGSIILNSPLKYMLKTCVISVKLVFDNEIIRFSI